jgi:hypothetical protein
MGKLESRISVTDVITASPGKPNLDSAVKRCELPSLAEYGYESLCWAESDI